MQQGLSRSVLPHTAPDRGVPASGGFIMVGYERFLRMPVAVVLAAMWLVGAAFLGSCVLALCVLGTLMA